MLEKIDYFKEEFQLDLNQVNNIINEQVQSDVVLINQIGSYIINNGGKRLRPIIMILAGKSLSYKEKELYKQAAMIEFIHTSTLLHDDVVDESDLRRGKETANHIFGNAAAVLVGDFLYTRAFQLMVSADNMRLMKIMADATNIIAAGEVMQLINIGNIDLTKEEYIHVIQSKTAKLFEASAQVGALLSGANHSEEQAFKEYGMYMGTAFQIIDDILDYFGDTNKIGKNVGDDLAEGKLTLPLIYLLQYGTDRAKKTVKDALENTDKSYFAKIHELLIQENALDFCKNEAKKIAEHACNALSQLKSNHYIETLKSLVIDSVNRIQ